MFKKFSVQLFKFGRVLRSVQLCLRHDRATLPFVCLLLMMVDCRGMKFLKSAKAGADYTEADGKGIKISEKSPATCLRQKKARALQTNG